MPLLHQPALQQRAAGGLHAGKAERQEAAITGAAEQKAREEKELVKVAHEQGAALSTYFTAAGREQDAAAVDYSLTKWAALRDEILISRSRTLLRLLKAALLAEPVIVAKHGLKPADATLLEKELGDFVSVTTLPAEASDERKLLTDEFPDDFAAIRAVLKSMNKSVLRFRRTELGATFAGKWKQAGMIRDRGRGKKEEAGTPVTAGTANP